MPLDPISTVHSLCTLATSLLVWLNQLGEKEEAIASLSRTVSRVCAVLAPYQGAQSTLELTLLEAFLGLGDVLRRTEEHLRIWGTSGKRGRNRFNRVVGFLVPAEITKTIRQDEQQLTQQLIVILFAISTNSYFEKNTPGKDSENQQFCPIQNRSVFEFWRDYLGAKTLWASSERFSEALKKKFRGALSDEACELLTFRIDEFRVGGVALSILERFVGTDSLHSVIERFMDLESTPLKKTLSQDSYSLPLLVWVDDNPTNNAHEVAFARKRGIEVIEITSTPLAKVWIMENQAFLRANDTPDKIRFISDNARLECDPISEPGLSPYMNITAGESLVRFLRGRSLRAPVLIYCGDSIVHTHYVNTYRHTGSARWPDTLLRYIRALADGESKDKEWVGCGYQPLEETRLFSLKINKCSLYIGR